MLDEKRKLKKQVSIASIFALLLFVLSIVAVATPVEAKTTPPVNSYTPATLSIGGGTLIAPLMTDWANGFNVYTGGAVSINYQAVGSTSGTNNMLADIFSLGFSDAPIPANGLATLDSQGDVVTPANSPPVTGLAGADPIIQIPESLAPVAIFYNIPGYRGALNLTGDIIAEIYLQDITTWTNYHILALNPGLTAAQIALLAKYPISPVHRSDGSGTSFALTTYFGRVDGNWTADGYKAGSTSASNFPASELSAKGTGGVAGLVAATNGAVGYGETSYAIGAGLVYAAVLNTAGYYVLPLPAGATAAAAAEASKLAANPVYTIVDANGTASYPISTFTYVFVWENQDLGTSGGGTWTAGLTYDAVQFLYYIVTQGQSYAQYLQYAPLPASMVQLDLGLIAQINYGGAAITPSTATSITCKSSSVPPSVIVDKAISCTATLSGALSGASKPKGSFMWYSTSAGTFSKAVCKVPTSGKCSTKFTPLAVTSPESIFAVYTGDISNPQSWAASSLTINQTASKTTLTCNPSKVNPLQTTTCKVTVDGYAPSGTVSVSQTGGSGTISGSASCVLTALGTSKKASDCSVTLTGATAGSVTLTASYSGDTNNKASSGTRTIHIK